VKSYQMAVMITNFNGQDEWLDNKGRRYEGWPDANSDELGEVIRSLGGRWAVGTVAASTAKA